MQKFRIFFGENDPLFRDAPSHREKLVATDRSNPDCPLNKFIGNELAIKKLQTVAYNALGHPYHLCRDISFAIFGPPSSGKTTLVKLFAKTINLPLIEFSPQVKTVDDMIKEIARVLANADTPLIEYKRKDYFELPPAIIFLDEIHAYSDNIIQALLKATEHNDAMLVSEKGKTLNCHNVCWMIATTDEGMLFDAFRSRFSALNLVSLNCAEIARIIKLANNNFSKDACEAVAFFNQRVPRKALEFARYTKMHHDMNPDVEILDCVFQVAQNEGIDLQGLSKVHRAVIDALSVGAVPKNRIALVVGRKKEEVERYIMPYLMTETIDNKAYVTVSPKGYILTDAGKQLHSDYQKMLQNNLSYLEAFKKQRSSIFNCELSSSKVKEELANSKK